MNAPKDRLGSRLGHLTASAQMSELPPKAEVDPPSCDVAKVPLVDMSASFSCARKLV
jgi:hypothetical protein